MILFDRNRQFLVGEEADPRIRAAAITALLDMPAWLGSPTCASRRRYRMVSVIGDVDLVGDDSVVNVAVRLRALEAKTAPRPRLPALC